MGSLFDSIVSAIYLELFGIRSTCSSSFRPAIEAQNQKQFWLNKFFLFDEIRWKIWNVSFIPTEVEKKMVRKCVVFFHSNKIWFNKNHIFDLRIRPLTHGHPVTLFFFVLSNLHVEMEMSTKNLTWIFFFFCTHAHFAI